MEDMMRKTWKVRLARKRKKVQNLNLNSKERAHYEDKIQTYLHLKSKVHNFTTKKMFNFLSGNQRGFVVLCVGFFLVAVTADPFESHEKSGWWYSTTTKSELAHRDKVTCKGYVGGPGVPHEADHLEVHKKTGIPMEEDHWHIICPKKQSFVDSMESYRSADESKEDTRTLTVEDARRRKYRIHVSDSTTIGRIKVLLQEATGHDAEHMTLLYYSRRGGRQFNKKDNEIQVKDFYTEGGFIRIAPSRNLSLNRRFRSVGTDLLSANE